jgi:Cytochrome C oxidase, cbb3-type, subunit III
MFPHDRAGRRGRGAKLPQGPDRDRRGALRSQLLACHGTRMQEPGAAFNLRKFPPDQRERFVNSVTRGKNQMPPWRDFFKPEQLEALWAYVMVGDR